MSRSKQTEKKLVECTSVPLKNEKRGRGDPVPKGSSKGVLCRKYYVKHDECLEKRGT